MVKTIIHLLYSGDKLNLVLNFFFLIYFIVLTVIYKKNKTDNKKLKRWKLLCFVPLIISIIHCIIFVTGSAFKDLFLMYINIYIPSTLIALIPLLIKKKILYNMGKIMIIIVCIIFLVLSLFPDKITNYTRKSLSDSYISLCDYLEKNYIMNYWKKMDYNKLKEEGLVLVKEAEQTGNIDKYYEALNNLVDAHHDGHMGLSFYNENEYILNKIKQFNDYGLSLITLDDETTIAVDVENNLEIKNGDIITKWNGVPINEAIDNVKIPISEALIDNEKIMKTFYLAGVGEDTVTVSYINANDEEITTTLNKIDSNLPRALKSFNTFNHTKDDKEYDYKMLNNNIGYLKIGVEETDTISDGVSYLTGNHKVAREKFRTSLRELKKQGMTKLVIDIRNNAGGYEEVSTALASLFTKEKRYAFSLGIKKQKNLTSIVDRYVLADGEFSDIEVLVLTGMRCGSAGDGMVLYLSRIKGITIAGLTNPAGINQETGGLIFMPEGAVIMYPVGLILDQNGNPNIDIDDTRISRTPLDIKIPLNKEAALKIFNGIDYELEWAIEYLKK